MVNGIGIGEAYAIIKGAGADDLSRRGHDDGGRDVFLSISSIVLLCALSLTVLRGRSSTQI